jgi:hypothetical protein
MALIRLIANTGMSYQLKNSVEVENVEHVMQKDTVMQDVQNAQTQTVRLL